ncbi:unnamed protein product, partial [Bubo scandiacus]
MKSHSVPSFKAEPEKSQAAVVFLCPNSSSLEADKASSIHIACFQQHCSHSRE